MTMRLALAATVLLWSAVVLPTMVMLPAPGHVVPCIVGGVNATPAEFPYMVALYAHKPSPANSIDGFLCGGSVVTATAVVTAAHCVNGNGSIWVRAGVTDLLLVTPGDKSVLMGTLGHSVHPDYTMYHNDIAIIRLISALTLGRPSISKIQPAPNNIGNLTGSDVTAIGWGSTRLGGPLAPILQKVTLTVIDQEQCRRNYSRHVRIDNSHVCTLTAGKSACHGDSGSPVIAKHPKHGVIQVGVTSFGVRCGWTYPGVSTRVSEFNEWITACPSASDHNAQ